MSHLDNSTARDRALREAQANQAKRRDPGFDAWKLRAEAKERAAVEAFLETIPNGDSTDPRGE
jgi:hypothetical protein